MPRITVTHRKLSTFLFSYLEYSATECEKLATKILTPALINTRTECEILLGLYNLYLRRECADARNTTAEPPSDNTRGRLNKLRERYQELVARKNPIFR